MVYADLALRGNENGGKGSLNMSMRAADGKCGEGPSARVMKPATGMKGMMCGLQLPLVLSSACCLSVCLSVCVRACVLTPSTSCAQVGQHHWGMSDVSNLVRVALALQQRGATFRATSALTPA